MTNITNINNSNKAFMNSLLSIFEISSLHFSNFCNNQVHLLSYHSPKLFWIKLN